MQQHKHYIKTTPQFVSMAEYSYICTIRPTRWARHIGESVTLLSSRGNLVHFNLDEDRRNAHRLVLGISVRPVLAAGNIQVWGCCLLRPKVYQSLHGIANGQLHTFHLLTMPSFTGAYK